MSEETLKKQDIVVRNENEGSPWFWKLFGGAIISIISVLFVLIMSHITSTLNQNGVEARESAKKLLQETSTLREKTSVNEQAIQSLKDKLLIAEVSLKERILSEKDQEKQIFELKEKILRLETKLDIKEKSNE